MATAKAKTQTFLARLPLFQEATPEDLDRIFLAGRDGPVPLGAIARLERGISPRQITHQGLFPAATITFNLAPGVSLGEAVAAIVATSGYKCVPTGGECGISRDCYCRRTIDAIMALIGGEA